MRSPGDRPARHPATESLLSFFDGRNSVTFALDEFVQDLAEDTEDGPEFTVALRKLLEARDCLLRHAKLR